MKYLDTLGPVRRHDLPNRFHTWPRHPGRGFRGSSVTPRRRVSGRLSLAPLRYCRETMIAGSHPGSRMPNLGSPASSRKTRLTGHLCQRRFETPVFITSCRQAHQESRQAVNGRSGPGRVIRVSTKGFGLRPTSLPGGSRTLASMTLSQAPSI